MEKKTYQKPKTKVIELKVQQQLLSFSGTLGNIEGQEAQTWL